MDAATRAIDEADDHTAPMLGNVNTVGNVNTALTQVQTSLDGVNLQLARLDAITPHAPASGERGEPGHRSPRRP